MARGKDLAALAGLAGLAYAMRNKDEAPKGKEDTGPGYKSTETRMTSGTSTADDDTKSDVLKAITAKKEAPNDQAVGEGVLSTPSVKPKSKPAGVDYSKYTRGMSASGSSAPASKSSTADYSKYTRGMAASAPSTTVSTPSAATKTSTDSRVPTPEQAAANRQAAYDKVKSVGSSVVDYVKNFETPAERRSREAKEAKNKPASPTSSSDYSEDRPNLGSAMRRGGAVKKMASGGMTASRRADGIASRGKTRCKMY